MPYEGPVSRRGRDMQVPVNIKKNIKVHVYGDLALSDATAYGKSGVALLVDGVSLVWDSRP